MLLGLPDTVRACLFDMDGVITDTAALHAAAWKELPPTRGRTAAGRRLTIPSLLARYRAARRQPDDPPGLDTVHGLGRCKNSLFKARVRAEGVTVCQDAMAYVAAARDRGLLTGVVTSSTNCREILRAAKAETLFDAWIDGLVAAKSGLQGRPHPDTFLAAARDLGQGPSECAVFEDALAGMEAGRSGHFGWVVGVDRVNQFDALYAHGAGTVVADLASLIDTADRRFLP